MSRTDLLSTEDSPVAGTVSRTELLSTEDSPVLLCADGTETSVEWDKQKNVFRARQIIDTCGLVLLLFLLLSLNCGVWGLRGATPQIHTLHSGEWLIYTTSSNTAFIIDTSRCFGVKCAGTMAHCVMSVLCKHDLAC